MLIAPKVFLLWHCGRYRTAGIHNGSAGRKGRTLNGKYEGNVKDSRFLKKLRNKCLRQKL